MTPALYPELLLTSSRLCTHPAGLLVAQRPAQPIMTVPQPQSSDIPGTLVAMAAAVQAGDFAAAETIGAAAALPLSIPKASLQQGAQLSEGAQATVYAARYTPAGASSPVDVAVKRPRIRESADLERFRAEVGLLATLRHPGLVTLLGARMLPPGAG